MFDYLAREALVPKLPSATAPLSNYDVALMHRLDQALDDDDKRCLAEWTQLADSRHQSRLLVIRPKVEAIQPPPAGVLTLYRGFGSAPRFQDMMGFAVPSLAGSKLAPGVSLGTRLPYANARPLSFSQERTIAEGFGPYLVETKLDPRKDACLILSDELTVVIQRFTNQREYFTQREVILLTTGVARPYTLVKAP